MAAQAKEKGLIYQIQRRYLECSICTELFNEKDHIPKLLPCYHTFCVLCLKTLYRREKLKCPTCNGLHKFSKDEFYNLPKDNTRRDLTSFLDIHTAAKNSCITCGFSFESLNICNTCDVVLCFDCCKSHKRKYPSHQNTSETVISSEVYGFCRINGHDNGRLKYFCQAPSCQKALCATCAMSNHRDKEMMHDVGDIAEIVKGRKDDLKTALCSLKNHIKRTKDVNTKYKLIDNEMHAQRERFTKTVERIYDRGINALNENKKTLIQRYNQEFTDREKYVHSLTEKSTAFLLNAEECCSVSDQLLESKSYQSFLTVDKTLRQRIQEFLNTSNDTVPENETKGLLNLQKAVKQLETAVNDLEVCMKNGNIHDEDTGNVSFRRRIINQYKNTMTPPHPKRVLKFCATNIRRSTVSLLEWFFKPPEPEPIMDGVKRAGKLLILMLVLIFIGNLPGDLIFSRNNFVDMSFNTERSSTLACRTVDNKTVSSSPDQWGMICGWQNEYFKYEGVFGNKELQPYTPTNLEVTVRFREHFTEAEDYEGVILFEFGLTTRSVSSKYLVGDTILVISGYSCRNAFGVCLNIEDGVNKFLTYDDIFISENNHIRGKFSIQLRPQKGTISFVSKTFETILLHKMRDIAVSTPLIPVFAAYKRNKIFVSMTISQKNGLQFNRSTLHPNLYISDDNKTFSNRPTSSTTLNDKKTNQYIYAAPVKVGNHEDIYTIIDIQFTHIDGLKDGTKLFELGFGAHRHGSFYKDVTFECLVCAVSYHESGYCLQNVNSMCIINQNFRIIMHYTIKTATLNLYIPRIEGGRSYYIYSFKQFDKEIPKFFIGKMGVKDITASWKPYFNLFEGSVLTCKEYLNF